MSQKTNSGVQTNLVATDMATEINRLNFIIKSSISKVRTSIPVQVIAVSNAGGLSPVGTVNVQILVNAVDGAGNSWPHGIIYNVPYMRIQGGANGIILDPQVNDIGIAIVCDRDISTVQNVGKSINPATGNNYTSAPGSGRKNDLSDMIYIQTIIGAAPTQYVQFNSTGITITSPTTVTINATNININGKLTVVGDVETTGTLKNNTKLVGSTHTHSGVTTGSGTTGAPT
jgi:hypothetical protein